MRTSAYTSPSGGLRFTAVYMLLQLVVAMLSAASANGNPAQHIEDHPHHLLEDLERELHPILDDYIRGLAPIDGQGANPHLIGVRIHREDGMIIIDISSDFLDLGNFYLGVEQSDQLHSIYMTADTFLSEWGETKGVQFLFDGRPVECFHSAESPHWPFEGDDSTGPDRLPSLESPHHPSRNQACRRPPPGR